MSSQCKCNVKMMLYYDEYFHERFGMTDIGAVSEAGMVVGFNEKAVCSWRNDFYANRGELLNLIRASMLVHLYGMTKSANPGR